MPRKAKEADIDNELDEIEEGNEEGVRIDPIIRGMLMRLPAPGEVWPSAAQKAWLTLLEGAFGIIYKSTSDKPPGA